MMTLEACRKWLVGIWGVGFIIPFILILLQDLNGKYGPKDNEVLGWLTTLTLPTILLMLGVIVANPTPSADRKKTRRKKALKEEAEDEDAEEAEKSNAVHELFIFKLAVGVSIVYLLIINLVFFYEPFALSKPQELMRNNKIYLAVFDSILSLLIGYFFGKR